MRISNVLNGKYYCMVTPSGTRPRYTDNFSASVSSHGHCVVTRKHRKPQAFSQALLGYGTLYATFRGSGNFWHYWQFQVKLWTHATSEAGPILLSHSLTNLESPKNGTIKGGPSQLRVGGGITVAFTARNEHDDLVFRLQPTQVATWSMTLPGRMCFGFLMAYHF